MKRLGKIFNCENCTKQFYRFPSQIKKGYIRFCCSKCRIEFNKKVEWQSPQNQGSSYIDGDGRVRVYLPKHPRACKSQGYVLRAIVHYEFYNKCIVSKEYDVHHENENKQDDSKNNLKLSDKSTSLHCKK